MELRCLSGTEPEPPLPPAEPLPQVHSFFIFVCSEHYGISISNHYPVPIFHDRLSFSTACFSPVYSISCTENLRF